MAGLFYTLCLRSSFIHPSLFLRSRTKEERRINGLKTEVERTTTISWTSTKWVDVGNYGKLWGNFPTSGNTIAIVAILIAIIAIFIAFIAKKRGLPSQTNLFGMKTIILFNVGAMTLFQFYVYWFPTMGTYVRGRVIIFLPIVKQSSTGNT